MSLFKKHYAKYLIYYTIYNINCIYKQLKNPKPKNRAFSTGPQWEPVLKSPERSPPQRAGPFSTGPWLEPGGYASVSVDRVEKGCGNVPLDIEGGDGEKTLGEAEKTFICWRKRFIIIPQHRFVCDFTSYIIYYELKLKKSLLTKLIIVFFAGTPPT